MQQPEFEHEQEEAAAHDAAQIGGRPSSDPPPDDEVDPATAPLIEAGEGEAEGYEEAELELIEHAEHGDQHAARRVLEDAPAPEDERAASYGEADSERSSELTED
jgi:hypothetical protein